MTDCIVSYKIQVCKSVKEISEYFAQLLIEKINSSNDFFAMALSGGTTPKAIFEYLARQHNNTINWDKVKFFWGDERCLPPNDPESNFKMANDSLLSKLQIPVENIFKIKGENDPLPEADRYSSEIQKRIKIKSGYPQFDLIMLGLGEDGHTASIFPNQKKILTSDKICATAVHPSTRQKRITLTGSVIINAATVVFIVTGKNKSRIVELIINQKDNYKDYPASFIHPKDGELYWLLDEDAASTISRK